MSATKLRKQVLKDNPRAVVHLRRQFGSKRFGLILGAGMSKSFKIPLWKELIKSIAEDPTVDGWSLIAGDSKDTSFPYKTELLFQHFRKKRTSASGASGVSLDEDNQIYASWLLLCAKHIYKNCPSDFEKTLDKHAYLKNLIPLVQDSHITVNFNFDDFLENALSIKKRPKDSGNRGFEIVTNPWPQFRRQDSVIYHPHGIFPEGIMEMPTDRFVFSEAGYANKYVGQDGNDSSFLLAHFARNTCLIIGCSLEDALRNVLIRSAHINPGNYHYYVHFLREPKALSTAERVAIADTNFNVYNLITLFLTDVQINALLELISPNCISSDELRDLAKLSGACLDYFYYLTGPLGVGKSTTTNQLRNLFVLDEWLEKRPAVLGRRWDNLTKEERSEADDWIIGQFGAKNNALRHLFEAIVIVDRPPLDPLAFTKPKSRPSKAKAILDCLCPDRRWDVVSGVIILLTGNCTDLATRLIATGRNEYTAPKLEDMQRELLNIYSGTGVEIVDTRGLSVIEVVKRVAQIVHRGRYLPFDLTRALKNVATEPV